MGGIRVNRLQRELEDILNRYSRAGYFPAACVRVFDREKTLAVACVGGIGEDAVFDVASLTKIATATQLLMLMDEGKIAPEDRIVSLLPPLEEDSFLRKRMESITLYALLTHTSTLPDWYPFYAHAGEDFYRVLRIALESMPPVSGAVYSDLNFMLLGKLLERLRGKSLSECLADFAKQLDLGRICYHPAAALPLVPSDYGNAIEMRMCAQRGIAFSGFRPLGVPVVGTVNDGNTHYFFGDEAGHAGIFADALAYEKLCRFYMNAPSSSLLWEAQREQAAAPGRGIGLQTGTSYPHGCGHTGFTGTGIYFSSEYNIGAVTFTNRLFYPGGNPNPTGEFRRALQEAVFALR